MSRAGVARTIVLLRLAPDIQEEIVFLPRTHGNRAPIHKRMISPIASTIDWHKQRQMWAKLKTPALVPILPRRVSPRV